MKQLTFALALACCAGQASALSCMRPDVARSFHWAAEAEEAYSVFYGRFDFSTPPRTRRTPPITPTEHTVSARFSGQVLGIGGFQPTGLSEVTLHFTCLGSWCGSVTPREPMLAFAQRTADGYVVRVDPCFSTIFPDPSPDVIATVEACMRGEDCTPAGP